MNEKEEKTPSLTSSLSNDDPPPEYKREEEERPIVPALQQMNGGRVGIMAEIKRDGWWKKYGGSKSAYCFTECCCRCGFIPCLCCTACMGIMGQGCICCLQICGNILRCECVDGDCKCTKPDKDDLDCPWGCYRWFDQGFGNCAICCVGCIKFKQERSEEEHAQIKRVTDYCDSVKECISDCFTCIFDCCCCLVGCPERCMKACCESACVQSIIKCSKNVCNSCNTFGAGCLTCAGLCARRCCCCTPTENQPEKQNMYA